MAFISYAQNFEDVMLWRALKHIDKGFYVDVGAWDPVEASVTKAFYDRGWRGINIEPIRYWYDKLVVERPEDINLNIAVSDSTRNLHMYNVLGTGLSTFDKGLAEKYKEEMACEIQDTLVPTFPLDTVLEKHLDKEIHFLKVDVEGAEKQVFASIDLIKIRPWIILSEITNLGTWEHLLTDQGYSFVYFDGLNRFYLANERTDLIPAFNAPPNVFDSFVRYNEWHVQTELDAKDADLRMLQSRYKVYETYFSAPLRKMLNLLKRVF